MTEKMITMKTVVAISFLIMYQSSFLNMRLSIDKSNYKSLYLSSMRLINSIIAMLIVGSLSAQDSALYKKEVFADGKDTLRYRILYPTRYDMNKKYPVVLFLHGAGERGDDNEKQLVHGAKLFADSAIRAKYPAFVIFPQCPTDSFWANINREPGKSADSLGKFSFNSSEKPRTPLALVSQLMDSIAQTPQVNTKKIYVGGLSMGGMGTFEILWRKPKFFAAAIAICGGGDPEKIKIYAKNFPIWVFHGDSDDVVPVSNSRLMVNRLRAAGAKVKYSEYAGVTHNSWDNAFAEPDLLRWLFAQQSK
jgi:predicted peptidase